MFRVTPNPLSGAEELTRSLSVEPYEMGVAGAKLLQKLELGWFKQM